MSKLKHIWQQWNKYVSFNLLCSGVEGLCLLLKRLVCPCRYDTGFHKIIYENHFHRLTSWNNQPFLSPANLQLYAQAISRKGSPLKNCFGFVDGTVRQISRPGDNQHLVYNGHKRVPALKFQAVVIPSGLAANLYGPVEGRRHDAGMLEESGLLNIFYYYYFLLLFYFISHPQTITIHYIYNSLQVTVIVYKKEIKRKRKTKSTKIL